MDGTDAQVFCGRGETSFYSCALFKQISLFFDLQEKRRNNGKRPMGSGARTFRHYVPGTERLSTTAASSARRPPEPTNSSSPFASETPIACDGSLAGSSVPRRLRRHAAALQVHSVPKFDDVRYARRVKISLQAAVYPAGFPKPRIKRREPDHPMHYLLFYEIADDYLARRAEFRAEHLALAWAASERGELVLAGALADPVDGALLLFKGDSPAVAENFAGVDPYVTSGIVKRWHVRNWNTVVGEGCATPVRPAAPAS